jgi:hypothetical protein
MLKCARHPTMRWAHLHRGLLTISLRLRDGVYHTPMDGSDKGSIR